VSLSKFDSCEKAKISLYSILGSFKILLQSVHSRSSSGKVSVEQMKRWTLLSTTHSYISYITCICDLWNADQGSLHL